MPAEPLIKRAVSFIDGQNLYHSARESFGYTYPNYDIIALSRAMQMETAHELDALLPAILDRAFKGEL